MPALATDHACHSTRHRPQLLRLDREHRAFDAGDPDLGAFGQVRAHDLPHGVVDVDLAGKDIESETSLIWDREMVTRSYIPRWLRVRTETGTVGAIGFVADRAYEHYINQCSLDETAQIIATTSVKLGTCLDYLRSILENLNKCGITDKPLQNLLALAEHKSSRDM